MGERINGGTNLQVLLYELQRIVAGFQLLAYVTPFRQ